MLRKWKFLFEINKSRKQSLYIQITTNVINEIMQGRLRPGDPLPGARQLAELISVNRKTVVKAYSELSEQGWIDINPNSGGFVSHSLPKKTLSALKSDESVGGFSQHSRFSFRQPQHTLTYSENYRDPKLFDDGVPDPRLVPKEALISCYREAWSRAQKRKESSYGDPRGAFSLRQALASKLNFERGLAIGSNNISLTRGSQMALYLCAKLLVNKDDIFVFEELTYQPALETFRSLGAKILNIKLDEKGANIDELKEICKSHTVRGVYLTPHHQYPTTVVLSPYRRLELAAIAKKYNFVVIEDDYDHEFHYDNLPRLPIAKAIPEHAIYIGSLSKTLNPSLRIGYLASSVSFIECVAREIMLIDRQGDPILAQAIAYLLNNGEIARFLRKAYKETLSRRDAFGGHLQELFGQDISYTRPSGGLAYWVKFLNRDHWPRIKALDGEGVLHVFSNHQNGIMNGQVEGNNDTAIGCRFGYASLTSSEARQRLEHLKQLLQGGF